MNTMRLEINKKLGKQRITAIEYSERILGSEVRFFLYNDCLATMLIADSPDWVRNVINLNRHNLKEVGVPNERLF